MTDAVRIGIGNEAKLPPIERLHIRFETNEDALEFANEIKEAAVTRLRYQEKFSSIRLASVQITINDFMHPGKLGLAHHSRNLIEARERVEDGALGLAATILHECAHMVVGAEQDHNENWRDACFALGLLDAAPVAPPATLPSHFEPLMLKVIVEAIERFARKHPELIFDPNAPIPWPAHIGLWTCPNPHDSYGPCSEHRAHILQFQDEDIRDMLRRKHGILLANEMGTGKTVELMGYINATHPKSILIVCPNNATLVHKRHLEQWCVHEYELEVARARFYMFSDVVICNYESALKLADVLKKRDWDLVVFDEGHYLKNPSAKRSRACYSFHGKKQIIMTGSPIVNYVVEVFPLAHWLDKQNFSSAAVFESKFGGRGEYKFGYNLGKLNALLRSTVMIRRLKKDVLPQLPVKRRSVIEIELNEETRALVEEEMSLWNSATKNLDAAQAQFLAMMKNESDTTMSDEEWGNLIMQLQNSKRYAFVKMAKLAHNIALAKLPFVYEHIEGAIETRDKAVVFGHHRDVLEAIAGHFPELHPVIVYGGQSEEENMAFAERFSTDDACKLFVCGIKVAQGWSLRGASTGLFVEQDWVPGAILQAEDRVHGIGRGADGARSTMFQHLVFEDSLDSHKAQYVIRKLRSIDKAVGRL